MSKLISIIVPTYNRAAYLKKLIIQLLSQSQPPHEIIVVDDHSTDNTATLIKDIAAVSPNVKYIVSQGRHQRDAKKTGLKYATGEYLGFFDDDAQLEDKDFLSNLQPHLAPNRVVQAKIILEQMGRQDRPDIGWKDILATRPYPILELITSNFNCGTKQRFIFPLIEWGNFWHRSLREYFIDDNLIKDAYGESYSASLKLYRAGIKLLIEPSLVIRHLGAPTGGSHKFHKKTMLADFTEFHYGYFYNMIYLHKRFFPRWAWLWLPFYFLKSLIALAINRNFKGWYEYAYKSISLSLSISPRGKQFSRSRCGRQPRLKAGLGISDEKIRSPRGRKPSIFIWQGYWRGGAERITLSAAKHFSQRGISVKLGVYQVDYSVSLPQIAFPELKIIPVSFRSLAASVLFRIRYAKYFSAVYAHTLGVWKTRGNKVFIHDAADLDTMYNQISLSYQKPFYAIWRYLYCKLCLTTATVIFSATPQFSSYLTKQAIPQRRIVPSASFYNDSTFFYQKHPTPKHPIKVLFIGNPTDPRKNFSLVQKLFYKNYRYKITIAGTNYVRSEANFLFLGWIEDKQLQQTLLNNDIFFLPSFSEGFSVALLEALAAGIPCLASQTAAPANLSGIRNLITYKTRAEVIPKIEEIIRHYTFYNVPDPRLRDYTQSAVLEKELLTIKKHLPTIRAWPSHRKDKVPKAAH